MAPLRSVLYNALYFGILLFLGFLTKTAQTAQTSSVSYVEWQNSEGQIIFLPDNRQPALYTQSFGSCLTDSPITLSRFDAAYYQDNATVTFHFEGSSIISNESLTLSITVFAYGESRFDLIWDPCDTGLTSLCPTNANVPIEASGPIPLTDAQVADIPNIALQIPDFEGQAIFRIFSNETESEIACYTATIVNGHSFSHPAPVGAVLGVFTFITMVASFATAIYGNHIPTMRLHYAHSMSVFVVISVFQNIFFTGALSLNWPSVLPAFWSNYAWSAGIIYSSSMQNSINRLTGNNAGNITKLGAASSGSSSDGVGGGYSISSIYKRAAENILSHPIGKRDLPNVTTGYPWYGTLAAPGLPLPGNYSGFAGTLSSESIPTSNAFLTGLIWFLILVVILVAAVVLFKWTLEGLSKTSVIKTDRLSFFRAHWLRFTSMFILRILYIAFFSMIFLSLFQLTFKGSVGVTVIAAIVFVVFFCGIVGLAIIACCYRLRTSQFKIVSDSVHIEKTKIFRFIPGFTITSESKRLAESNPKLSSGKLGIKKVAHETNSPEQLEIHEDKDFVIKFGWLSARFRRTKWWFFVAWLIYEFVRACFLAGAVTEPLTQIFGLLVVEVIALFLIALIRPFEGSRLTALMVYILGLSKIATLAISVPFHPMFNLNRIIAAVLGIAIIIIQGFMTIALLVLIVIGAVSTYMSLTRNREDFHPRKLIPWREKYFNHIRLASLDRPVEPAVPEEPVEPYFAIGSVRRLPKIGDEDDEKSVYNPFASQVSIPGVRSGTVMSNFGSRAPSMRSTTSVNNLPFGARAHRISWSSRDFSNYHNESNRNSELMNRNGLYSVKDNMSNGSFGGETFQQMRSRSNSRGATASPLHIGKTRTGKERASYALDEEPEQALNQESESTQQETPKNGEVSNVAQTSDLTTDVEPGTAL